MIIELMNELYNIYTWKYIGDEVLFYREIKKEEYDQCLKILDSIVKHTFKKLHSLAELLEKESDKKLSLKSTVWLAPIDESSNNINITPLTGKINKEHLKELSINKDFLGIHVDQGFRISKHFARRRQLTLSFEVAYLLVLHYLAPKPILRKFFYRILHHLRLRYGQQTPFIC